MRILVYGAGAVGSALGGFLASKGHAVTLLGRSWHLDVIRRQGLSISGIWGSQTVSGFALANRLDQLKSAEAFDWIFVCVKSHQTRLMAASLPSLLKPATCVCAFQNGLGNEEILREHVPGNQLALGRIIFGSEISPGKVHISVNADDVRIGSSSALFPSKRLGALAQALRESGVPAQVTDKIQSVLWAKVLYNSALNGLSALYEVPYGELLNRPAAQKMMGRVISEAYQAAKAHQVMMDPNLPADYQQLLFTRLIPGTAQHHSSMLQDIERGRLTEIDAINGAIARLSAEAGFSAPINALIARLVHAKERFWGCI